MLGTHGAARKGFAPQRTNAHSEDTFYLEV